MNNNPSVCLVILAGGLSRRMGTDKAVVEFGGHRLIDILINRFVSKAGQIFLSASQDYGTGLDMIRDDPDFPGGPVGAILSVASRLRRTQPEIVGFVTVPVDAPYAPADLIERLSANDTCAVAKDLERIHPTFAYWRCDVVDVIRETHDLGEQAPSLHWLARQSGAETVTWSDDNLFANINRPQDLKIAELNKKAGAPGEHRLL